jgi:hypothetical protein
MAPWIIELVILLGMFVAFTIVCVIADALGLSLFDHDSKE